MLRGFKHKALEDFSLMTYTYTNAVSVDTLSFFPKTAEPAELPQTINLYKYAYWKKREISEKFYRLVATSPVSPLKSTHGFLRLFLQIASHTRRNFSLQNLVLLYLFLLKVNRKWGYNFTLLENTILNIKLWSY